MNASELREKNLDQLNELLVSLREEQFRLRLQHATEQLGQTHLLGLNRKDIARVKTVRDEKVGDLSL